MATVAKDFRIKSGLAVEGANGTINGYNILTESQDSIDFIVDTVGGSSTSENQPNTVVKRDGNGNFAASQIDLSNQLIAPGVVIGDAGYLSDEGVLALASSQGGSTEIYGDQNVAIVASNGDIVLNPDGNLYKGSAASTNEIITQSRLDAYVGDPSVNSSTGNTITDRITSAVSGVAGDLSTHISDTSTHGVDGSIVGTTDAQTLTNKTINDELYFTNPSTQPNDGGIKINDVSEDMEIKAYTANLHLQGQADVTVTAVNGDIVLAADGATYINSVSAGNQVATNAYVDNAVSGLSWKDAVNLLSVGNLDISGSLTGMAVDGHPAFDGTDANYRILLTGQANPTENGIYILSWDGADLTASRSADADTAEKLIGAAVFVTEGSTYAGTSWVQNNHYANSFDDLNWTQFSGNGTVTAGQGIVVDGLEISIDRTTVDTWYEEAGSVSTHSELTTGVHGVSGNVVGTSDTQTLSNKVYEDPTLKDRISFTDNSDNETMYIEHSYTGTNRIVSNDDLAIRSTNGDIILYPGNDDGGTGKAYIHWGDDAWNAYPEREIATHGYVDGLTSDAFDEGSTNLYFTNSRAVDALEAVTPNFVAIDINSIAKQVAATSEVFAPTTDVIYSFPKAEYRSAEFLVKIASGTHTEISKILLTLDSSDNVAITEYGIVGTNGSLSDISAQVSGSDVNLFLTPAYSSTVTVVGTLLA